MQSTQFTSKYNAFLYENGNQCYEHSPFDDNATIHITKLITPHSIIPSISRAITIV